MRSSSLLLSASYANLASAATLSDVCTISYVTSALPADNFIQGITINTDTVTANPVRNYTVASAAATPPATGINFCNVTFTYTHAGLNDKVGDKTDSAVRSQA
jgi:tannase